MLWGKAAAWLIAFGLVVAIVPRLLNLVRVWITARRYVAGFERIDFWMNFFAIVAAIFNSFVHSRDAYGSMPDGLWLSVLTVLLLSLSHGAVAVRAIRRIQNYA